MTVAETIYDQIRRLAAGELVDGVSWGGLVRLLNDAMRSYRNAAVRAAEVGDARLQAEAENGYDQVKLVWDTITEVYRLDPQWGIDRRGSLGAPQIVFAIAAIVTGAGLVWFAQRRLQHAGELNALLRNQATACERHGPGSPECIAATARADRVVAQREAEGGIGDQVGRAAAGIGLLLGGLGALLLLSRR